MIDLRSDTVTKPCLAMKEAMFTASLGDDVYGDDPTVNELEAYAAKRHGFDSALFVSSGTQANLLAIMGHCGRGDEYICGQNAHNYKYEAGGASVLGSVQPQPIENEIDGSLCFHKLTAAIKPDDFHFARTKMLSLENTIGGKVLSIEYMAKAQTFCQAHGLILHLDGARVYNAAIALNVDIEEISRYFDSMTICLSKGLGAPVGSLLLGERAFIDRARRIRKMLGGGMRQAGFLAAAGLFALKHNVERLREDHANALYLSQTLNKVDGFSTEAYQVETNIVYVDIDETVNMNEIAKKLKTVGILLTSAYTGMRLVTHKGVSKEDIDTFITYLEKYAG